MEEELYTVSRYYGYHDKIKAISEPMSKPKALEYYDQLLKDGDYMACELVIVCEDAEC